MRVRDLRYQRSDGSAGPGKGGEVMNFTACIEKTDAPTERITIKWCEKDKVPNVMRLPDGRYIVCVGKFASPGDQFIYRETEIYHLADYQIVEGE
jgi:hypothetical protein